MLVEDEALAEMGPGIIVDTIVMCDVLRGPISVPRREAPIALRGRLDMILH
jgi:hypothetical protein